MSEQFIRDLPRLVLTFAIIALFAFGIFAHYSNGLEETLKNIVMLAVGFWLGSSKGTSESNDRADKALDLAKGAQDSASEAKQ
jgi:hypothetical protein